jgi:DNA-binding CsgD family transcriptional regulator
MNRTGHTPATAKPEVSGAAKLPRKATPRQRTLLVDFCRVWSRGVSGDDTAGPSPAQTPSPIPGKPSQPSLGPRLRQTLDLLLAGDAEKQIAGKLGLSQHTIHDYVKAVYRRFGVGSRAELLALWVRK